MPSAEPYIFTHGDWTIVSMYVNDGDLVGILIWEHSGFYPVW